MHLVMFDIDGTLIKSCDFDAECFEAAVKDVLGISVNSDWAKYQHVTASGILNQIVEELDLSHNRKRIELSVKENFTDRIKDYLSKNKVLAIDGAPEFLVQLVKQKNVSIAFATGDWLESAKMKLEAAGFHFPEIYIASCSDHYSRIEIMKKAQNLIGCDQYASKTFFGDGPWDKEASLCLDYNFVLVGDRITYHQSISDFTEVNVAINYIGL